MQIATHFKIILLILL